MKNTSGLILFLLLFQYSLPCEAKKDPIVQWVESEIKNKRVSSQSSWNPGLSFLDETEVRIETDEDGVFSDQSVRFGLKPIFGLANEVRLAEKHNKILKLTQGNQESLNRLNAYNKILILWGVLKNHEVLKQNQKLFEKARKRIRAISQNSEVDLNGFIENLGFFAEMKTQYQSVLDNIKKDENANIILGSLKDMKLSDPEELKQYLKNAEEIDFQIENEKKELAELEFKKKKSESWQVVKFVQMSRERDIRRLEDHKLQLSLRIPFLSDSTELKQAETDYLKDQIQIRQEKWQKQDEMKQLRAETLGLIEKFEIYKMIPMKSKNAQRFSSSLSSLETTIDEEVKYIKLRLRKIETLLNIHANYLKILFLQGELNKENVNYLTEVLKI